MLGFTREKADISSQKMMIPGKNITNDQRVPMCWCRLRIKNDIVEEKERCENAKTTELL